MKNEKLEPGQRVTIPTIGIEFDIGNNTIWVQGIHGATILRIKCSGKINASRCNTSPVSHSDVLVDGDIDFCISSDALEPTESIEFLKGIIKTLE